MTKVTWTVSLDLDEDYVDACMTINAGSRAFFEALSDVGVEYEVIEEETKLYEGTL